MAVAVKATPETAPQQPLNRLAVGSLMGTLYVLGCLAIIYVIPVLWGEVISPTLTSAAGVFVDAALRLLVMLGVAALLVVFGQRLIGPNPPAGIRAGICSGIVGVLIVGLITAWIGTGLERSLGESGTVAGIALTAVVGVALLVAGGMAFFRPGFERWLVQVEEQGWFSTAGYKRTQGQRVRRGTILGIQFLAGSGLYTLLSHKALEAGPGDWGFRLPFVYMARLEKLNPANKDAVLEELEQVCHWNAQQARELVDHPPQTVARYLGRTEAEAVQKALQEAGAKEVSLEHQLFVVLPHVRFTVPLLLAALALWCAYRIVNLPVFADFLIATEAELNKVSWTTRKRLVQDTIVVLTTMLLLTGFLFVMDSIWIKVLSFPWIDVLQTEKDNTSDIGKQGGPQEW